MKKILLIIVLLSFGFSQQEWNMEFMRKYVVDDDTLIFSPNSRKPYSGKVFSLYDNGKPKKEGKYRNGIKHGLWTEWFLSGQKWSEGTFNNGKEDGKWTGWWGNGQKKGKGTFNNGKPNGKWTGWWINGQKAEEGTYKVGKPDGLWIYWYENGQKKFEVVYKDGKLIDDKKWDEDGNLIED